MTTKSKETLVKQGILKILEDINPGIPQSPSSLQEELQKVLGIEVAWDTTKKYAEELADDGRIKRKKWDSEEYDKASYLL